MQYKRRPYKIKTESKRIKSGVHKISGHTNNGEKKRGLINYFAGNELDKI